MPPRRAVARIVYIALTAVVLLGFSTHTAAASDPNTKQAAVAAFKRYVDALNKRQWGPLFASEPVKRFETCFRHVFCARSCSGSLIQAMVGSFGGSGRRCRNRAGLAV